MSGLCRGYSQYGRGSGFCGIEPDSYTISLEAIEKALKKKNKLKIKGNSPGASLWPVRDMGGILKIAKKHRLKVVEDTAQAAGL